MRVDLRSPSSDSGSSSVGFGRDSCGSSSLSGTWLGGPMGTTSDVVVSGG